MKNKAGNPIDSAVVTFAVVSGAGSVGATSVRAAMNMGHGDSVFSAGTALGTVHEISVATGAVRRRFSVSTTIADVDISADGKRLFVADGTSQVSMTPLATGGLSGSIDFGLAVTGVAESPDANQFWVSQGNAVYAAPADGNSFNPSLVAGRATVARH